MNPCESRGFRPATENGETLRLCKQTVYENNSVTECRKILFIQEGM